MSELGEHHCSACGEVHGGEQRTSPEVEIARINAKRDVEIARMEYREAQELAAVEAETAVVVTELETEASVAVAEETDAPAAEDGEGETQSIIVEGPPAEGEPEADTDSIEPSEDVPPEPAAKKSFSYWP